MKNTQSIIRTILLCVILAIMLLSLISAIIGETGNKKQKADNQTTASKVITVTEEEHRKGVTAIWSFTDTNG